MAFGAGLTRGAQLLTHRTIETLRPAEAPYRVPDQRCKGLAVRVAPSGVKTWDLAYRIRGTAKMRRLSLGRTTDVSLEQARERANELTSAARGGRDLIGEEGEARDAAASRITVEKLIDLYLRRRVVGRLRTAKSIESRLRRTLAPILQRYAADICRRDIRAILDSIADRGQGREAEKRRQVCTAMFRWALSQDIVEADPTAGLTPYDRGAPRDRVLTLEEIELVWKWLDSDALSLEAADILKLELLTGAQMRGDQRASRRGDRSPKMDLDAACLRARKMGVSASRRLWASRARCSNNGYLASRRDLSSCLEKGVVVTSAHIGHYLLTRRTTLPIAVFTSHDLRRTFATMLAEMGIALDLVAAIVGHESGGKDTRTLVRHYVHTDMLERKAHALRAWDERLRQIVSGEARPANVVEIRQHAV